MLEPSGAGHSSRRERSRREASRQLGVFRPCLRPLAREVSVGRARSASKGAFQRQPPANGAASAGDCRRGARGSGRPRSCSQSDLVAEVDERRRPSCSIEKNLVERKGLARPCESTGQRTSVGSRTAAAKPRDRWRADLASRKRRRKGIRRRKTLWAESGRHLVDER